MKKKIISLLLITVLTSATLISCGKTNTDGADTTPNKETTEQSEQNPQAPNDSQNSSIIGENNAPTVEVNQIATIADFKDKDSSSIEKLLGKPVSKEDIKSTYKKDGYSFEITYFDSKCGQIKITPDTEMKFPADATNILKLVGISAGDSDEISPAGLIWNNKFDTYKISVVSNNLPDGKISYVEIILAENYK